MSAVAPADNTYAQIERMVRRLTASASESALRSVDIQNQVNIFYTNDFPYGIKLDQMRDVYTFLTSPNVDQYPLDVNYNQGVRDPLYVDGVQGFFYKDRREFFNMWPKWPTRFNIAATISTGSITGVTNAVFAQVTSANHGLLVGAEITITGVVGMVQLNGNIYVVTSVVDANNFKIGVDSTAFTAYTSGGTWTADSTFVSFSLPGPFLANEVTIGGVDVNGNPIRVIDNGYGRLYLETPNPVTYNPALVTNPAKPGMYNANTGNPGLMNPQDIGSVNYVTGSFAMVFPIAPSTSQLLNIFISQYQTGKPYSLLFWNNTFTIRPVPKLVHKIEIETYLTPVQFMLTTDSPILNQWVQYIAYGTAMEILRQRQDMAGVQNLMEGFKRQEGLVLERQGTEEINQRNQTIFASSSAGQGVNGGWNQGFWY